MKTTSNRHLINLTFIICTLLFSITLSSCDLFINEEPEVDDYGFTDVPVHTGEGYDKPVTAKERDCEVTYQLQSNVRQLTTEDTQQWITYVEQDETGLFMEIHYSGHTPQDRLPVLGEILLSTDVTRFPMGCMHRVQMRELRDGEYCYIASLAKLGDTYKKLDITGSITTAPEEYDVKGESSDSIATARSNARTTRGPDFSGDDWYSFRGMHVQLGERIGLGYEFGTDPVLSLEDDKHPDKPITVGFAEGSYYTVSSKYDFTDFSFERGVYKVHINEIEEGCFRIKVSGTYDGKVKVRHFRPVEGKPILIGPVLVILFVNLNFDIELKASAEATLERSFKITHDYTIDFSDFTLQEKTVNESPGWKASAVFSGDVGLRTTLEVCFGLYGKVLSLRIYPSVYFGVHADTAPVVFIGNDDEEPSYDVSSRPGITPKVNWQLDAGLFLELSIFDWFKELFGKLTKSNAKAVLSEVAKEAKENGMELSAEYWNNVGKEAYERQEKEDKSGLTVNLGEWDIVKPTPTPWYPTIEDNSFKIDRIYDEQQQKMIFMGSYTINSVGFFCYAGQSYIPTLLIKKGTKVVDEIFPDDDGKGARVKNGKLYMFTLPNYEDDVTYMACPSYHAAPLRKQYRPEVIDKGLPFMGTTPSVTINQITATSAGVEEGMHFADYGEDVFKYKFTYGFDINVTVRGAENIQRWGVFEGPHGVSFDYKRKDATKLRDGTYVLHCKLDILSDYLYDSRIDDLRLYPFFFSDEMTGNEYHTGPTNHLYITYDGFWNVDGEPFHHL